VNISFVDYLASLSGCLKNPMTLINLRKNVGAAEGCDLLILLLPIVPTLCVGM